MSGFWHVCLLQDYVPSHTSELLEQFLKLENVTHHTLQQIYPSATFFLFQNPKGSYLVVVNSPDYPLAQPLVRVLEVYYILNRGEYVEGM